jgi:hypothetical protein
MASVIARVQEGSPHATAHASPHKAVQQANVPAATRRKWFTRVIG